LQGGQPAVVSAWFGSLIYYNFIQKNCIVNHNNLRFIWVCT
jgi:hypothetical protein